MYARLQDERDAVEPASAMLEICRQKAEENGITSHWTFHEGYLDLLPASEPFDGATCLLVSQFIKQAEERRNRTEKSRPDTCL